MWNADYNWRATTPSAVCIYGWTDEGTLEWLRYALSVAHESPKVKRAALRLLARARSRDQRHEKGRSDTEIFELLREPALERSRALMPELCAHAERQGLVAKLASVGTRLPRPLEPHELTGGKLSQKAFLPFMRDAARDEVERAKCRVAKGGCTSNSECLSDLHESDEPYGRRRKNSRGEMTSEAVSNI